MPPFPSPGVGPLRRILVVQTAGIGDALLTTPALRALADHFPGAHIDTLSKAPASEIFRRNPHVEQVFVLERSVASTLAAVRRTRRTRYDLLIDYHGKARTGWIALLGKARHRLGYDRRRLGWRSLFYDLHGSEEGTLYSAAGRLAFLAPLGIRGGDPTPEFVPDAAEAQRAEAFLCTAGARAGDRCVALSPATHFPSKTWPRERWIELARTLAARGERVFAVASPDDDQRVLEMGAESAGALTVAHPSSLSFLAAVFRRMRLVVADCSGPRHLAVSQGVPTLTLHGGNQVGQWQHPAPIHRVLYLGLACQPCHQDPCPLGTTECLRDLSVERVLAEADERLPRPLKGRS